jgi:hypothetical protein
MIGHKAFAGLLLLTLCGSAFADKYDDTVALFKEAGASNAFFSSAYGYALFPTIGKAGFGIGGARGKGQVFIGDRAVGKTTMTQLTVGFQIGGQGFSQIIFLEDARAFREFSRRTLARFASSAAAISNSGLRPAPWRLPPARQQRRPPVAPAPAPAAAKATPPPPVAATIKA